MSPLTDRSVVANLLKSHKLHTNKKYGQNFLISDSILQTVIAAAQIDSSDTVVEVGPGIGTLTTELARHAQRVITFEIEIPTSGIGSLTIYNVYGQEVSKPLNSKFFEMGLHTVSWDASGLSGMFVALLQTESKSIPCQIVIHQD